MDNLLTYEIVSKLTLADGYDIDEILELRERYGIVKDESVFKDAMMKYIDYVRSNINQRIQEQQKK